MTDVFISYKREDEAKVARLAEDAELLCAVSDSELERRLARYPTPK